MLLSTAEEKVVETHTIMPTIGVTSMNAFARCRMQVPILIEGFIEIVIGVVSRMDSVVDRRGIFVGNDAPRQVMPSQVEALFEGNSTGTRALVRQRVGRRGEQRD